MEIPPVLYKYVPPERVDILENMRVRFTQASALNDPHECTAAVDYSGMLRAQKDRVSGLVKEVKSDLDPELVTKVLGGFLERLAESNTPIVKSPGMTKLRRDFDSSLGMLCLARQPSNGRMWAYYGDGHRGFCLGFRTSSIFFANHDGGRTQLLEVKYQDKPPTYDLLAKSDDWAEQMYGYKSNWWADEEEFRLLKGFNRSAIEHRGIDASGFPIVTRSVPPDAIAEIVLGARVSESTEARIRMACTMQGLEPKLKRVRVREAAYDLEVIDASL